MVCNIARKAEDEELLVTGLSGWFKAVLEFFISGKPHRKRSDAMLTDPTEVMEPIMAETERVLKEMKGTRDLDQREIQSRIVKNLCESLGVFFGAMSDALMAGDMPDLFDDDDE